MSGPFSRRNPYDNEPTELSSRWSFYKTKRQQLKDKRDAERRQALLNQNNIIRQQKFTPTPISDINIDSLPPEAQSEALIAEANASNPNPALREENKGWFSKLMQKWDDSTVQGAGSPLNPFNAVINVFNPNAARQLEIKRRRYKREYKDSGLSEREAQLKSQRAAWRETDISQVTIGGKTIDPVKFLGEVVSDKSNFIFFGAGVAFKGVIKGGAAIGRKKLRKEGSKFVDIGKTKMGNTKDMVLEDEVLTNPGFYWQKQTSDDITQTFFAGSEKSLQNIARKKFQKYMLEPEKIDAKTLRTIYEDQDIFNALSRYKKGNLSNEAYSRAMTYEKFEQFYKAPIVKSDKTYLSNPKSDYQYLALQGTADTADSITNLKAFGYAIAGTESKLAAPLRFAWKYFDPAPFQVKSKLGRALLVHGARENDNKVLVANAVRKQTELWKELGVDPRNLGNVGAFNHLLKNNYDFLANGENVEALDYWATFLESAFVLDNKGGFKLAKHINATEAEEKALRGIIEGWGEHGMHLVENGVVSPGDVGLKVIQNADGSIMYEHDLIKTGQLYIGSIVESIGERDLRVGIVNFSKASGQRTRKYINDFKMKLDDEIGDLTRDEARKMGINYLNDPISVYDIKSGEIMDRINDSSFVNRMKILGDKRFEATDDYMSLSHKIDIVRDTFDDLTKTIDNLADAPKLTGKKSFLAAGINEFGTELKEVISKIDGDVAPEIQETTKKMLEVLDGPMNQRARQLENVEKELISVVNKMDTEGAVIKELQTLLNKGLPFIPPTREGLEKSTRTRIEKVLGGASHKFMQGAGEFDADTTLRLNREKILDNLVGTKFAGERIVVGKIRRIPEGMPVAAGISSYSSRKLKLPKNIDELRELRKELTNLEQTLINANYSKATVENVTNTKKEVYRIIKEHNENIKAAQDFTRDPLKPIKNVLNKLDELQQDNPILVSKVKNSELFNNLDKLIRGYSAAPSRAITNKFKQQIIGETKTIVNNIDKSISTRNILGEELLSVVGIINTNPNEATKHFGKYFTKTGRFKQAVMKDIEQEFPAVADILQKFQQDPKYLNEYNEGLQSLKKDLLPEVQKTLSTHFKELQDMKLNYYKRKNWEGKYVDVFGRNKIGGGSTRLDQADLVNVNLRNGIPTKELENYFFTNAEKKQVEAFFGQVQGKGIASKFQAILETTGTVGDILRIMKVGYDLGAPLIQGLPLLIKNPAGWARASGLHYRTFFQGKEAVAGYMAKNSHIIDEMIEAGVEISGDGLDYYSAFKDGTLFNQVLEGVDKGIAKVPGLDVVSTKGITKAFNEAFDVFGDIARIEMYQALKDVAIKKSIGGGIRTGVVGAAGDSGNLAMMQLADTVNKMTGVFSSRARGANRSAAAIDRSWLFFSPRYTRASTALIADALMGTPNSVSGYAARHTLFRMLNVGMMGYIGTVELYRQVQAEQGIPEEERVKAYLDPRPVSEGGDGGKFMKIRMGSEGRESYVGVGGYFTSFLKLASNIALDPGFRGDKSDSPLFMTDEAEKSTTASLLSNPIIQWLRGRQPPTAGLAWDLALGHDFIGNPLETPTDWGKHIGKQSLPFWIEHGFSLGDENLWDRPAGMLAEIGGFAANEISDWQELKDLKDELSMKHHGVMWDDLPVLQQEEIKLSTAGTTDDIQLIEETIYEERKKHPLGNKIQEVMPDWFKDVDEIQAEYDKDATAITSALNNNEIDVAMYVKHMNSVSRKRRLAQQDLKKETRYGPVYKNFEYQTIDSKTGVADYFFNEYMTLISDNSQYSLLPTELKDIGLMDSDMIDWDAKNEAVANFEERVGPQVMQYINKRLNTKPRVDDTVHPVYQEYIRGREKYLNDYYQRVEQEALALRGDEAIELWNSYKKAPYPVREELEKVNPIIKQINNDIRKARKILRKNNPDLDAFLYRFNIGGTSTMIHKYNQSDYRKGELSQPFPMERYTPGFTTD